MKYVHTNIISRDWKMLAQFYIDVFNCTIVPPVRHQSGKWLAEGTGVEHAALEGVHLLLPGYETGGPTLEIYTYSNQETGDDSIPNRTGYGHIAFEVDDVSSILNKAIQYGGIRFGKVVTQDVKGKGTITFTYIKDPEGNLIELQSWEKE